jgi:hypothetical protein
MNRCKFHLIQNAKGSIGSPIVRDGRCIQCLTACQTRVLVPLADFNKYRLGAAKQRILLNQLKKQGRTK